MFVIQCGALHCISVSFLDPAAYSAPRQLQDFNIFSSHQIMPHGKAHQICTTLNRHTKYFSGNFPSQLLHSGTSWFTGAHILPPMPRCHVINLKSSPIAFCHVYRRTISSWTASHPIDALSQNFFSHLPL